MNGFEDKSEIVFFDLETTLPTRWGQGPAILEFGSILVCPRKLIELESYSTLVCPNDLSLISDLERRSGITEDGVLCAPSFAQIADKVYDILHGRIWAGHNILGFDCDIIREAYAEINRPPPEPKGILDTLALLKQKFGTRAGNMKMDSLAMYFGIGKQTHRSLDDVRMNLKVLKYCATVLFLEASLTEIYPGNTAGFYEADQISLPSISVIQVPSHGTQKIQILYNDAPLQLLGKHLKVRFGVSFLNFVDYAGRPRLAFVANATPSLCGVLDTIDNLAQKLSTESGSWSEWRPMVIRKPDFLNSPTLRLNLLTTPEGNMIRWDTEIYQEGQRLQYSRTDDTELESIATPGSFVDAYLSLDAYDYQHKAGIRLVVEKLIVHSN